MREQAEALLGAQGNRAVAIVSGQGWHPGVIGIVASRLKERSGRPAIVIALDGGIGKGSGRSVSGVDLGAAVMAAKDAGLLVAGGGHAMAAGLTIDGSKLDAFADFLDERLGADVAAATDRRALLVDAVVGAGGVTPALVEALEAGGPYGAGWPSPRVAAGRVRVVKADVVGNGHVRAIVSGDDGRPIKAMAFGQARQPARPGAARRRQHAPIVAGGAREDRRLGAAPGGRTSSRRRRLGGLSAWAGLTRPARCPNRPPPRPHRLAV